MHRRMQEARYLPWGNLIQCVYKRQRTPGKVPWEGLRLNTGKPLPEGTPGEPSRVPDGHYRKISPGCDLKTDQRGGRNQKDTPRQTNEYQKRMELLPDTPMRSPEKIKHGGIPPKSTGEEVQQLKEEKRNKNEKRIEKKTSCAAGRGYTTERRKKNQKREENRKKTSCEAGRSSTTKKKKKETKSRRGSKKDELCSRKLEANATNTGDA